jgi:hypothetical protein
MGFDRHRVMEVFVKPPNGPEHVGSGYRVNETATLPAGCSEPDHVPGPAAVAG